MSQVSRFALIAFAIGCPLPSEQAMVLDFGCGSGTSVIEGRDAGVKVFGCDLPDGLAGAPNDLLEKGILRPIDAVEYRLPFKDNEFDMVISNEVLEHVQNYEEAIREIRRVLKRGGVSIHVFPSRHTPVEPHVFVPLATMIQAKWWLGIWAHLGVRNRYQKHMSAKQVAEKNHEYLSTRTNYLTVDEMRYEVAKSFPEMFFVEREYLAAGNRYGPLLARLPLVPLLFGELIQRVIAFK